MVINVLSGGVTYAADTGVSTQRHLSHSFCRSRSRNFVLSLHFSRVHGYMNMPILMNRCLNPDFTMMSTNLCPVRVAPTL